MAPGRALRVPNTLDQQAPTTRAVGPGSMTVCSLASSHRGSFFKLSFPRIPSSADSSLDKGSVFVVRLTTQPAHFSNAGFHHGLFGHSAPGAC